MRPLDAYLADYAADHRNPVNRALHKVCVPVIVFSLIGLLWSLPVPAVAGRWPAIVNWSLPVVVLALGWYLRLSPRLAAGMALFVLASFALIAVLDRLDTPLWLSSGALFAAAWAGQFVGHAFEGRRPSFLRDLRFLLIGPLWVLGGFYARLGLRA